MGALMSNLLGEYRRRHNSNFIWAATDGVCFFNKNKKPAAVCVLTEPIRSVYGCCSCSSSLPKFVCEFFTPSSMLSNRRVINMIKHEHIGADTDISKVAAKIDSNFVPFVAKDQKDIESWLWSFFLQTDPFNRYHDFDLFVKNQDKKMPNFIKATDQMVWTICNAPDLYSLYYSKLYQPFLIGRHYLLYK